MKTYSYIDAARSAILVTEGDEAQVVPNDPDNRHYAALIEEGVEIAPFIEPPDPVPRAITMRQLLIGLMGAGWITPVEADAWSADGTLPKTITAVIDALPTEAERVAARITARKMSSAYRNDPLLIAAAQAAMPDATEQEISDTLDQAFREWSQL